VLHHHDSIPRVDELLQLDSTVEHLQPVVEVAPHGVMAGEHTDVVGRALHGPPIDRRVPELRESIEAVGVERRKGLSNGLHVLLRHRLLRG